MISDKKEQSNIARAYLIHAHIEVRCKGPRGSKETTKTLLNVHWLIAIKKWEQTRELKENTPNTYNSILTLVINQHK